jgi:hypothetical protein
MPKGDWQARLDEYFRDAPRRVVDGTNGYKADMLRGLWAQAPYLHNGSVPSSGLNGWIDPRPAMGPMTRYTSKSTTRPFQEKPTPDTGMGSTSRSKLESWARGSEHCLRT